MAERFVYNEGTISVSNGATSVTGIGTTWANRDRAGSFLYVIPAAAAPIFIGVVAETSPRNSYVNNVLPLVNAYNGTTQTSQAYVLVDGLAIANSATLAANLARFNAFLEENAGLVFNPNDAYDSDLVPNNSLVVNDLTGAVQMWRNGILKTVFAPNTGTAAFSAHKNATNQTGLADNAFTAVTFGTEVFDTGSFYNAGTSAWVPPAGKVLLQAAAVFTGTLDATAIQQLAIYKNGSLFKEAGSIGTTATAAVIVTAVDDANGTDSYTVQAKINVTASTGTVSGTNADTYFMGSILPQAGAQGAAGTAGATGQAGADGGFSYQFNTATAGDPGSGKWLFNNATFMSATSFSISETDVLSNNLAALLTAIATSTNANRCLVNIIKANGAYVSFFITSAKTDNGAYDSYTITPIGASGSFSNNDPVKVFFHPIPDQGATGVSGTGTSSLTIVRVVSISNITISTALNNGDVIDGVTLVTNDLVLVVGQTSTQDNGVYIVQASPARATGFTTYDAHAGAYFSVMEGGRADTLWRCTSDKGGTINVSALAFSQAMREVLTGARSYFVRADGSDLNNGRANTAAGAFLTIQKAIDVVSGTLDLNTFTVTINVGTGTYTNALTLKPLLGRGTCAIVGNTTTPSNCVISVTSATAISCSIGGYDLAGFKSVITTGGYHINVDGGEASLIVREWEYGASPAGWAHINVDNNGKFLQVANYTISSGSGAHWQATNGGTIQTTGRTITLTGTPAFGTAFVVASRGGGLLVASNTFSGAATGPRYSVNVNAYIDTFGAGASYLPGNAAGSAASGGQYV